MSDRYQASTLSPLLGVSRIKETKSSLNAEQAMVVGLPISVNLDNSFDDAFLHIANVDKEIIIHHNGTENFNVVPLH